MERRWRSESRVWLITVWAPRLGDVRGRMLLHSRLKGSAVSRPCSALKVREERARHQHILPGAAIPRGKGWGAILRSEGPHPRHKHVDAWVGSGNTWPQIQGFLAQKEFTASLFSSPADSHCSEHGGFLLSWGTWPPVLPGDFLVAAKTWACSW